MFTKVQLILRHKTATGFMNLMIAIILGALVNIVLGHDFFVLCH